LPNADGFNLNAGVAPTGPGNWVKGWVASPQEVQALADDWKKNKDKFIQQLESRFFVLAQHDFMLQQGLAQADADYWAMRDEQDRERHEREAEEERNRINPLTGLPLGVASAGAVALADVYVEVGCITIDIATGGAGAMVKGLGKASLKSTSTVCKILNKGCFTAGTLVLTADGLVAIETLKVGDRVLAETSGIEGSEIDAAIRAHGPATAPDRWRVIELDLAEGAGTTPVRVRMLRPLSWCKESGVEVNGRVWLSIHEAGLEGLATVRSIERCPSVESGRGRLITTTFNRVNTALVELEFVGGEVLRSTASHQFFSKSRGDWVQAGHLERGETLRTERGSITLKALRSVEGGERVYNIEVSIDHCYFVGADRVLSHNMRSCAFKEAGKRGKSRFIHKSTRKKAKDAARRFKTRAKKGRPRVTRQTKNKLGAGNRAEKHKYKGAKRHYHTASKAHQQARATNRHYTYPGR